jgi:hypothetical protein
MVNSVTNLNYSYSGEARSVLSEIKSTAKRLLGNKVAIGNGKDSVEVVYVSDRSEVRFHLSTESHMNVIAPSKRSNDAIRICSQLEHKKVISKIHEKTSQHKSDKKHDHASVVLKRCMDKSDFEEHILVLPSAVEEASECEFEYDSVLESNLKKLVAFAKLKRDPKYAKTLNEHLAKHQAGLGHFADGIGEVASTKFASDYTAEYKGIKRLFKMHITIGNKGNPKTCMSIYMDWDPEIQKIVIARFGRHGRGADDK